MQIIPHTIRRTEMNTGSLLKRSGMSRPLKSERRRAKNPDNKAIRDFPRKPHTVPRPHAAALRFLCSCFIRFELFQTPRFDYIIGPEGHFSKFLGDFFFRCPVGVFKLRFPVGEFFPTFTSSAKFFLSFTCRHFLRISSPERSHNQTTIPKPIDGPREVPRRNLDAPGRS